MNYHKIEKTSIANGTGIRVVLWVSGCLLHCKSCHNPETWDFNSGKPFDEKAKKELFEALDKPYIQGITFSGGHPLELMNAKDVLNLITEIRTKFPQKDIWLYTGYQLNINNFHCVFAENSIEGTHHNLIAGIINLCDVIVDGKFIEELKDITLKWKGSSNQRVIDVRKSIQQYKIVLYEQ